jgi:pantetheine-phosphate adenylyltransferase
MGLCGPSFVTLTDIQCRFPDAFTKGRKWFHPGPIVFRRLFGTKHRACTGDAATRLVVQGRARKKSADLPDKSGTGPACGAARGEVEGFMPRIALYPGSFDPVTNGHLDVVRHAVGLCDRLIVAIGVNTTKKPLFSTEERLEMVEEVFAPIAAAAGCAFDCTTYDGLTVVAAQKQGATIMIRGLRDGTDLDFEMQISGMNEAMAPEVHTVFVPASVAVRPITATLVRQIAGMGGDVSAFVPPSVAASLKTKFAG